MNKKERVIAAIRHESVDYVPCGFSLHFPHDKAYGEAGVKSHLDFFKETDTDIIKIMNENLVPYVGELTSPAEYERLVRGFSMKSDFMQAQVDFTKAILDKADSTAFSIGTLHGVTASSIHPIEKMGISYDKTREILVEYLREDPAKMQSAMQIGSAPLTGFAQGFVPISSYNYGHGYTGRVKECFRVSVTIMFTFNAVLMLLMILFPHVTASAFTNDAELIDCVDRMMPYFLSGITIFGLQRACQNTFMALGQAKISLFIALLRKVILLVPLAIILPKFWGVKGVFAAESIADFSAAICCISIFIFAFPRILRKSPRT